MLPNVTFTPIKDFSIAIGYIRNGWMEVTIADGRRDYNYVVSYVCEPLDDLLRMMVKGITNKPYYESNGYLIGNQCCVVHDTEGDLITWAFFFDGEHMHITIWHDTENIDLIDDVYMQRFDVSSWEYEEFLQEVDVNKYLLFAIEGPMIDFATHFHDVLAELSSRKRKKRHFKDWGYKYSAENFEILSGYVKNGNN